MMNEISVKKNIAFSSSSQIITIIASFIVNWFLARYLGPDLRGRYVYLLTINSVVWMLLDFGVSKSFTYSLQHDKANPRQLYSYTITYFFLSLIVSTLFFAFVVPHYSILKEHNYSSLVLVFLGLYIVSYQLIIRQKMLLIGMNYIKEYALLTLMPTVILMIILLPSFWLIPPFWRMEYSFVLNASTLIICMVVFHVKIVRKLDFQWSWNTSLVKRSYKLGYKAFFSEYLIIILTRVDLFILKRFGTFSQIGVYTLSVNFLDIINTICNMFGVVLLTKFSSLKNDVESLAILRKVYLVIITFNVVSILGFVSFGWFLIKYLYGSAYLGAYTSLLLLIPAIFGITLGALFNTFLWSKGFPLFTILAPILPILIKIVINIVLIPKFGYYGAAISSSICYPLWFIILLAWYFVRNKANLITLIIPTRNDFKDIKTMVISSKNRFIRYINI